MVILVDLDETLIHSVSLSRFPYFSLDLEQDNILNMYKTCLRPFCREFLESLNDFGDVVLCTASTEDYASKILETFNLTGYFSGFIFREQLSGSVKLDYSDLLLIDNLPLKSNDIRIKLTCVGVPYKKLSRTNNSKLRSYHLKVHDFLGDDTDTHLLDVFEKVKKRCVS